ncbi:MAG: transglutaminase domain-containing protein [Candidatus Fimousia sp.]
MKILKRILYFILGLFGLFCGLVLVCAFNPEITDAIAEFLYPEQNQIMKAEISNISEYDSSFDIGGMDENVASEALNNKVNDLNSERDENQEKTNTESNYQGIDEDTISDYLPPDQSEILIPENVSGRNGYQQIQDEQEQIDEETAVQLQNQLDTGYTGEGLDFDTDYYPYYAMLDGKGKHLYRQIYANANELYSAFTPVEAVTAGELKSIFSAVFNDHPELFWLETAYSGKYVRSGQCVEIDLKFNRTAQNLENAKSSYDENANQILAGAWNLSSNYEKEKYVHDALIDKISYNLGAEMNQSAYSALVNGQTVCAGYARAFQYLLQRLGIPCYYCTGFAGESHAWNIVALDDGYYNVDTTWDDTDNGTYDYFNKTDADYASNHIRQELSVYLPPCNGQAYRDLEQTPEDNNLRSLENVGMTEEQIITDIQRYNENCYSQILQNGTGRYTFYNVIEGEDLLNEWYQNYTNENYRQAYMENAMIAIGASSCEMALKIEELQGGRYLIAHEVSVW